MQADSNSNDISQKILRIIKEEKPQSVKQIISLLKEDMYSEEEIIEAVKKLQVQGEINLDKGYDSRDFAHYLRTKSTIWYWTILVSEAITAIMVFTISEDFYPWFYIRNVLGIIFVLLLPGYAFIKTVLPFNFQVKGSKREIDRIERFALSLGMSLALVSIIALVLYYTPWGVELTTIVISLLMFTSIFATIAVTREYSLKKEP